MATDSPYFVRANKKGRQSGGPSDLAWSLCGLWRLNCLDRCDDYRGCSIRKRNDPRPVETFDF
jgi:hypothetical protein